MARSWPRISAGLLTAASILFIGWPLPAGVVINEVGYHMDPRSDTGKEWIELFNPDTAAIDLSGFDLFPGRSAHYLVPQGYVLAGRGFVTVHLRQIGVNTATDLYEGLPGNADNMPNTKGAVAIFTSPNRDTIVDFVQYGGIGQNYEATAANAGLWTRGTFVDTARCGHTIGLATDGVDSNRTFDWADYAHPTPGYSNNPPPFDVAVVSLGTEPLAVPARQEYRLAGVIANRGVGTARRTVVTVFSDDDRDSVPGAGERVYYRGTIDSIATDYSLACAMPAMDEGAYALAISAACSSDAYWWNNYLASRFTVGSPIVINEIMYDPLAGRPEWVELYNRSAAALDLNRWTIEDLSGTPKVIDTIHTIVPAQGFVIVTQTAGQPVASCPVLCPKSGLPSLNNDDMLCLRDGRAAAIDQVRYSSAWGGGNGISLELINPFLDHADPASWGGCVAAAHATPGARNSVYVERPAADASLELSPNPFSPDGDGFEDGLIISLKLGWSRAAVTIRVYDRLGRLVRTLAQNREVAGNTDMVWNGRNDQGSACPIGLYVISLEARNANGSGAIKKTKTVAVARKL